MFGWGDRHEVQLEDLEILVATYSKTIVNGEDEILSYVLASLGNLRIAKAPAAIFARARELSLPLRLVFRTEGESTAMINTFTAIDFETAQGPRWSIRQLVSCAFVNGVITESVVGSICPRKIITGTILRNSWYDPADDHQRAHLLIGVSASIADIAGQQVVAHNGHGFDFHCIRSVLKYYDLPPVQFTGHCTYKLLRKNLAVLAKSTRSNSTTTRRSLTRTPAPTVHDRTGAASAEQQPCTLKWHCQK